MRSFPKLSPMQTDAPSLRPTSRPAAAMLAAVLTLAPLPAATQEDEAAAAPRDPRLAREARLPSAEAIVDPQGRFEARVPARLVGEIADSGPSLLLRLDLGLESPAECVLFREEADLAATLWRNTEARLPEGGPAVRRVYTVAATIHDQTPILVSDWIYESPDQPGEVAGLLKQMIASRDGRSVYCRHDEIGFSQTFAQVFVALATSLRWNEPGPPAPRYVELSLATLGHRPIGIERLSLVEGEDGLRIENRTAFVMPSGPSRMESSDGVQVEWLDATGALNRQVMVQLHNAEPTAQVTLTRQPDGGYQATGTTANRQLSTQPSGGSPPLSLLEQQRLLSRLATQAPADAEAMQWVPELDTGRFVPARFETGMALESGARAGDHPHRRGGRRRGGALGDPTPGGSSGLGARAPDQPGRATDQPAPGLGHRGAPLREHRDQRRVVAPFHPPRPPISSMKSRGKEMVSS